MARARKTDLGRWGDEPLRIATAIERHVGRLRPVPPDEVAHDRPSTFIPDPAFADWIHRTFIDPNGPLANDDHIHLIEASIGVLWTNVPNIRAQRQVIATAEIPFARGDAWRRARAAHQIRTWFEDDIDFLLTFDAPRCTRLSDRGFCALVEHELYHCAQAEGDAGPLFRRETGLPIYTMRGHDVEEHVGVVRRYGVVSADVRALVDAATARPEVDDEPIVVACGTGTGHLLRVA